MEKVNWGVLSTSHFALKKVIPAMQKGELSRVTAIASRQLEKAQQAARELGIEKAYASYEELLEDAEIDVIYNPLPNHLHVSWAMRALEAGKHVLVEKPLAMNAAEARQLLEFSRRYPQLKIMEAFMYRMHPQWQLAKRWVDSGLVGELRHIHTHFTYNLVDPANIRNQAEIGGGALMDIGCYAISLARFLFRGEPERVLGTMEVDPDFQTDRIFSGVLDFGKGSATFTCATQLAPYQRVIISGSQGRIEIEIPFNPSPDRSCRLWLQSEGGIETGTALAVEAFGACVDHAVPLPDSASATPFLLPVCDQYTIQGELFSSAVQEYSPVFTPLEDGVANMEVIDRLLLSARQGSWA